jgi:hypothetical protein
MWRIEIMKNTTDSRARSATTPIAHPGSDEGPHMPAPHDSPDMLLFALFARPCGKQKMERACVIVWTVTMIMLALTVAVLGSLAMVVRPTDVIT